jgi:rubrerythrin
LSHRSVVAGTKTLENCKELFAQQAMNAIKLELFADRADFSGYTEVSDVFRSIARVEKEQAKQIFRIMEDELGEDLTTGAPVGETDANIEAVLSSKKAEIETLEEYMGTAQKEELDWVEELFDTISSAKERQVFILEDTLEEFQKREGEEEASEE